MSTENHIPDATKMVSNQPGGCSRSRAAAGSRWTAEQIERGIDEHIKCMKSWVEWEKRTRNAKCKETDSMVLLCKEYEEKLKDEKSLREEIRGRMILS